jgi:putative redox protein
VDIDNAAQIFQAARHPKSFVSLDDADHLLTRPADAAYAADVISAWAARYIGKSPARSVSQRGEVIVEETGAGDFQVEVTAGGVHFLADEPVEVGGLGSGPTPYDLLCAGLGACRLAAMYARRKGWHVRRVQFVWAMPRSKRKSNDTARGRPGRRPDGRTTLATARDGRALSRSRIAHAGGSSQHAGGWRDPRP